jgi:hypothetical protein
MANDVPGDQTRREEAGDAAEPRWGGGSGRWAAGAIGAGLGAVSLVGGLTWTLLNVHSPQPVVDMTVGVVLALGGLVLLMPHRIPLPPLATTAASVATAVAGTAAGLAAGTAQVCCMYAYVAERGFPMRWVARGAIADEPQTAQRLAETADWHVDVTALVANVLVWGYVGMLAVALVVAVRRAR